MQNNVKGITLSFCVLIFLTVTTKSLEGKSVYAIPQHEDSALNSYYILEGDREGQLEYRATHNLTIGPPADVIIDVQSDILFVTFEGDERIELVNAKTFLQEDIVEATGASDLAGLALDYSDPCATLLYTVDRGTNKLFVYDWDSDDKTLTLIPDPCTGANYRSLEPFDTNLVQNVKGSGLVLDSSTGYLYVSQFDIGVISQYVHVYDTNDYFATIRTIDLGNGNYAVDIDIDEENGWLYAGGFYSHDNLIRYDLDPCAMGVGDHIEDIGGGVIGLAISQEGIVYMTTYNYKLEAWDTENWEQIDWEPAGSGGVGGAGVCVANVDFVPPLGVIKTDDVENCVDPVIGEEITYTISVYDEWLDPCNPFISEWDELESLTICDKISEKVDFVSMDPCDNAVYDPCSRTVTWTFDPNFVELPFSVSLVVSVNEYVAIGGSIKNTVRIEMEIDGREYWNSDTIYTDVCGCGENGDIIYVDKDATAGSQDGSSWGNAFLNLDAALEVATVCDKIYVAEGRYKPADTNDPNQLYSFEMVNAVAVYGGFAGLGEADPDERNWMVYDTILCGDITDNDNYNFPVNDDPNRLNTENSYYVVRSEDKVNCAVLDGFIIRNGWLGGILCDSGALSVGHNRIKENIKGIYGLDARMLIENNWIYRNIDGIYMDDPNAVITVGHCTVAYNHQAGIYFDGLIDPVITNSIIWGHSDEGNDLIGCDATYSCIEYPIEQTDPSDPNIIIGIGLGNIDDDPCFVDAANYDYHLRWDSPCIDAGDPCMYYGGKRDIDKQWREINGFTDMGADEYKNCCYVSLADFNEDEIVNLLDFDGLSAHWLCASSDPCCWDSLYDLDNNGTIIDIADLAYFAEDWLWMSCDKMISLPMNYGRAVGMGMPDGQKLTVQLILISEKVASTSHEPTIEELIKQLKTAISQLELLWQKEKEMIIKEVGEKEWFEFMDSLYKELERLIEQLN